MSRNVLCAVLYGVLLPACGEDTATPDSPLPSEGEGQGEGEGEGSPNEGEGSTEGEGEGPVCACASDADCQDGNYCNGVETCNCTCSPGALPDCADEFECTEDRCANNACVNVPAHARCGAGKICRPAEGGCVAPPPCRDDADCVLDDPCQVGACEAATRSCAFAPFDGDEDGHAPIVCGGDDCDDSTDTVNPESWERCNQRDDNCNGEVDEGYSDLFEVCNQHDDNCNGEVDEGFNLQTDREHCGQCENRCGNHFTCERGDCLCEPGFDTCEDEFVCTNLLSNNQHCGECWNECADGVECNNGECVCNDERLTACQEIGCVNLQDDPEHCGTCDNTCEGRIEDDFPYVASACFAGICRCLIETLDLETRDRIPCESELQCPARGDAVNRCFDGWCVFLSQSAIECGGQCVSSMYDGNHCGVCGNACAENEQCIEGQCRSCPDPRERFCQEESDGEGRPVFVCADLQNNATHCGECGLDCGGPGYVCTDGVCACAPDAGHCVWLDGEEYCTDLDVDMWNCGRCDNVCSPYGSECQNGQCGDCVQTWEFEEPCNGACVVCGDGLDLVCTLTATDIYNCGRCGNQCPSGSECQNGQCGDCVLDWFPGNDCNGDCVVCDGMADVFFDNDRVCAIIATDLYNCGRCGNRCEQNQRCEAGRCVPVN